MKKAEATAYRLALACLPQPVRQISFSGQWPPEIKQTLYKLLRRQHAVGAAVALFDADGVTGTCVYGLADKETPVTADTAFRAASVSKQITAMAAWRLSEAGRIDLDADVDGFLPCSVRHPLAVEMPITLRRLLSHTAGIHDGAAYTAACREEQPLPQVMQGDSHTAALGGFEYSNLGAGIAACVLEGMLQQSFEAILQETLFAPLQITASFYPQRLGGAIANAYRVLPPRRAPTLDAAARRARPQPVLTPDPARHYLLSQGNLYISAPMLARLGCELMRPRYAPMRRELASFGQRDTHLAMGLSTFIVRGIVPQTLYGHQGSAYGAVHGLFYDPAAGRGFALLTSGCSEARDGVLADINKELIKLVFHGKDR